MQFDSRFHHLGRLVVPAPIGLSVMMLPIRLENLDTLPDDLGHYRPFLRSLFDLAPVRSGVAYLTIDTRLVRRGTTQRRAGLHVDGVFRGGAGSWGGGSWGKKGMLTVASHVGCRAWSGTFQGQPGPEGECDHLREQLGVPTVLAANEVYWLDGLCVHESLPQPVDIARTFVRLSMPNNAPWFEGYTVNPKGVQPTGPIHPRRVFMDELVPVSEPS